MRSIIITLITALVCAAPLAAAAQAVPSYAAGSGDAQIRGRVVGFDGAYSLRVRDDKGYIDNVQLHPGTIINPTGLTLAPGMVVSVLGYNAGSSFAANEIDTPYTFYGSVPYYSGNPWNYYGSSVSLGFFFGNATWWHGSAFVGPYQYYGGARVYTNVHLNTVYYGGSFHGSAYAAPAAYGGYYPHGAYPAGAYHAPTGVYHAPTAVYHAPTAVYHAPTAVYHAPAGAYHAPSSAYHGASGAYHGESGGHGGGSSGGEEHGHH